MAIAVVSVFLGLPLWLLVMAVPVLVGRATRGTWNESTRPADPGSGARGSDDPGARNSPSETQ